MFIYLKPKWVFVSNLIFLSFEQTVGWHCTAIHYQCTPLFSFDIHLCHILTVSFLIHELYLHNLHGWNCLKFSRLLFPIAVPIPVLTSVPIQLNCSHFDLILAHPFAISSLFLTLHHAVVADFVHFEHSWMNSLHFHLIELWTIGIFLSSQNSRSFKLLKFLICHLPHTTWFLTQLIELKTCSISTLSFMVAFILEVLLVLHSFFCDSHLSSFSMCFSFSQLIWVFCLILFLSSFVLELLLELFSLFAIPRPSSTSIFYFIQFRPVSFCLQLRNFYSFYFCFYLQPVSVYYFRFLWVETLQTQMTDLLHCNFLQNNAEFQGRGAFLAHQILFIRSPSSHSLSDSW